MFDAAVVGGGLAGCAAAITLAQAGQRVLLLEAKAYPHHKVCGEFLSPECSALFAALGFPFAALPAVPIRRTHIVAPTGLAWHSTLPDKGWGISRYCLDAALVDYAQSLGVTLYSETSVSSIEGSLREGFTLTLRGSSAGKLQARSVVGAQGKRSKLDRALGRAFLRQPQPFLGLKNHFRAAPLGDHIYLYAFPGGYCGMSEVEDGIANVCLLVRQGVFQQVGGTVPRFLAWMQAQNPGLAAWLGQATPLHDKWFSISQVSFRRKSLLEGDVLMVGDAAGLIAPLAGDGMAMALYGGRLAAQWLGGYLEGAYDADHLRQGYQHAWRQQFQTRLRLGRLLQPLMLRPRWLAAGLHLVNAVPALGRGIIRYTRQEGLHDDSSLNLSTGNGHAGSPPQPG